MYQANIVSKGDERYFATTSGGQFQMASDKSSPSPTEVLLASLCGCLGHYVGEFLHKEQIAFVDYSVRAKSALTEDRTRLADIDVVIDVPGVAWTDSSSERIVEYATKCFVHNTLKANSRISIHVQR